MDVYLDFGTLDRVPFDLSAVHTYTYVGIFWKSMYETVSTYKY